MEQRTGRREGEKREETQTHSHVEEEQQPGEMISAPQGSAQFDSDASNEERIKETQTPSSEIDNGGQCNSDEKLRRISPSLHTQAEHETKNNREGDRNTQEEEQQEEEEEEEEKGRERLNRHWVEVVGRVCMPEIWGQEELLNDWVNCSAFEASLVPAKIFSAKSSFG